MRGVQRSVWCLVNSSILVLMRTEWRYKNDDDDYDERSSLLNLSQSLFLNHYLLFYLTRYLFYSLL